MQAESESSSSNKVVKGRPPRQTISAARPPANAPEHVRALWWRVHVVRLPRRELSEIIGISPSKIQEFENGVTRYGGRISDASWRNYRLACAAVSARLVFDWDTTITLEV